MLKAKLFLKRQVYFNPQNNPSLGGSAPRTALSLGENMVPKSFNPGRLLSTPKALEAIPSDRLLKCFMEHLRGSWGDALSHADWKLNDEATHDGGRLLSSYWIDPHSPAKGKFWIITEGTNDELGQRECTTVILPEEY